MTVNNTVNNMTKNTAKNRKINRTMNCPPGPQGHFLLGSLPEFQNQRLAFLLSLPQYGDLTFTRFGQTPVYTVHHPDLVHHVLVEAPQKFQKLRLTRKLFNRALRNKPDAEIRKTEAWKQRRELVQTALHTTHVHRYAETMVCLTQQMLSGWQTGQSLDIYRMIRELTLHIVAQSLFGSDITAYSNEIMQATSDLQLRASKRFNAFFSLPLWVPTADNRRISRAVSTLDRTVEHMIDACLAEPTPRSDLLALMLLAHETLQREAIAEDLSSLLMSGHETTATLLAWTFYLLSQHPAVEYKLREEIQNVIGNRAITVQDVAQLPYTEAVIKETLRLYPPSWTISRRVVEPVELSGYTVPTNALVYINPYSLHRDERWFESPEQFMPERFLPDNITQIPRCAFIPFGIGPRKCIGSAFATLEATLILVTVLQQTTLSLIPGQRIIPEPLISLRPKYGIRMKLRMNLEQVTR